jgi:hypothetical protein
MNFADAEAIAAAIDETVEQRLAPLRKRLSDLESQLSELQKAKVLQLPSPRKSA